MTNEQVEFVAVTGTKKSLVTVFFTLLSESLNELVLLSRIFLVQLEGNPGSDKSGTTRSELVF